MGFIRRLLAQRGLTTLICCAVLALKVLVPSGTMLSADHGSLTVAICSGMVETSAKIVVPLKQAGDNSGAQHHGQHEMPCPYTGLAFPALHAVDPIQLERLAAFIVAMGLASVVLPALARPAYLRPPLRGPPARL